MNSSLNKRLCSEFFFFFLHSCIEKSHPLVALSLTSDDVTSGWYFHRYRSGGQRWIFVEFRVRNSAVLARFSASSERNGDRLCSVWRPKYLDRTLKALSILQSISNNELIKLHRYTEAPPIIFNWDWWPLSPKFQFYFEKGSSKKIPMSVAPMSR